MNEEKKKMIGPIHFAVSWHQTSDEKIKIKKICFICFLIDCRFLTGKILKEKFENLKKTSVAYLDWFFERLNYPQLGFGGELTVSK